jgi:hypothetical protein
VLNPASAAAKSTTETTAGVAALEPPLDTIIDSSNVTSSDSGKHHASDVFHR